MIKFNFKSFPNWRAKADYTTLDGYLQASSRYKSSIWADLCWEGSYKRCPTGKLFHEEFYFRWTEQGIGPFD